MNKAITFTPEVQRALEPLRPELIEFWNTEGAKLTDDAVALLEIERRFGSKLIERICLPYGLTHGACLLIAMAVARQTATLKLKLS
jgi:hypothetical protein